MRREFYKYYGARANLDQLKEECAELIGACSKYIRSVGFGYITSTTKEEALENLKEEIADVENCIIAIKDLLNIDQKDIDRIIDEKDERTAKRIEESKG